MRDVERTARFSLAVSLAAVLAAIALAVWLAGRIAAPLAHLSGEMDRVGRFELDEGEPPPSTFREIQRMYRALSAMKQGLASFASYVPRDLVREVLASGQRAVLGGRTKEVTVFFSDLAGFTTLSESMEPAALVDLLGGYFDAMTQVLSAHGGTVDKFIGDAIMAFWNAPRDTAEHARVACKAALACQRRLTEMKSADPALGRLSARIGIATGDVLVGNIGAHDRMNYTVMGDTANLASRLEGLGKVYGTSILVSESTYLAARDTVVMRAIDVVAVKGKKHGVAVYEPLALVEEADPEAERVASLSAQAFEAYLGRRFAEAESLFDEIVRVSGENVAAALMRDRCRALQASPPGDDWLGVFVMHEK